ncbi:MAG: hypothetical protein QF632_05150 [Candidatus Woesearchaeota archaeon]|nr:hypothetical protein [Candidatus Woesearchaeota archaeon]
MKKVLEAALELVKPDENERKKVSDTVGAFLLKLNKGLKGMKAELGGSGAKETWTKGIRDADIYMKFSYGKYKDKSDEISDLLEKELKKRFSGIVRLHGSRDYFQIKHKGFLFEIIPILEIDNAEQSVNITDISPLHTKFVRKHAKYADDILLAKGFCKSIEVYGAESYIKGFSGYVIEILTIYYKGFSGFVHAAAKWKGKEIIDPAKYHKNIMFEVNKSKLQSPLVLIDPVEKGRNAAAALGEERYGLLIKTCKGFLKKPSLNYFVVKGFDEKKLEKEDMVVKAESLSGKADVVGSKLLKIFELFEKKFGLFGLKTKGWHWDGKVVYYWFSFKNKVLKGKEELTGPPVKMEQHCKVFKKKYGKVVIRKGKLYASVKRKYSKPEELVRDLIKSDYVKTKVKSIRC